MCPIFDGSQSNPVTRYQKILWGCSLGCKNVLNFIWSHEKFHNRHRTTVHNTNIHSSDANVIPFWRMWFWCWRILHSLYLQTTWPSNMKICFLPNEWRFTARFTLMTVYKTVSHHNGPFSTASKHKNEKVLIHMR